MNRSLETRLELVRERPVPWDTERAERVASAIAARQRRSPFGSGLAQLALMGVAGAAALMLFFRGAEAVREHAPSQPRVPVHSDKHGDNPGAGHSSSGREVDGAACCAQHPTPLGDGGLEASIE